MPSATVPESSLRLPSPPQVLATIIQAASDPANSVVKLSQMLNNDPAFAAEVLRVVNSPWFGAQSQVTSVMRAVAVLGSRTLRNMALCAAARNCVDPKELGDFDLTRYWEDSLRRGVASQLLAEELKLPDPNESFTAGLLQDLGVLALVLNKPDQALEWMGMVDDDPEHRRSAENGMFGVSHDRIGAFLAEKWQLPAELSNPLQFHHDPSQAEEAQRRRVQVAAWGERLASVFTCEDKAASMAEAKRVLAEEAGIAAESVDRMLGELGPRVEEVARAMGLDVSKQPSFETIVMAANRGLAEMNLSYEELVRKLEDTLSQLEKALAEKEALAYQLEARNRELHQLSVTDPLTGLPNRRAFAGRISYEIQRVARSGECLAMIIGDIDHFKRFNDTHGHDFGDKVLQAVAVAMNTVIRQTDMVARLGGEEFAVLLPATDEPGARVVAEKLLAAVSGHELQTPAGQTVRVTISLGIAWLPGPHRGSLDPDAVGTRVYNSSDTALYAAKQSGRNRAVSAPAPVSWVDGADERSAA